MKRAFLLLVAGFCLLYGTDVYHIMTLRSKISCYENGKLSDIAEKVTAIHLERAGKETIKNARNIKQKGDDLFLISNEILYRYDSSGRFIKQITSPEKIQVAEYLIDEDAKRLIVFGDKENIHFYSFEGEFINSTEYTTQNTWEKVQSVAFHNRSIWVVKEVVNNIGDEIRKVLVEYDLFFSEKQTYQLDICASGNHHGLRAFSNPVVAVAPDTGEIYIHACFNQPDYLLKDTLNIRQKRKYEMVYGRYDKIPVYPVTVGNRFHISCENSSSNNHLFCFDEKTKKVWDLRDGLKDNYYHTGQVKDLHPVDMTGKTYYFCKSGKDLKNHYGSSIKEDQTVVFIVQLKS